jgi:hypothetical protein
MTLAGNRAVPGLWLMFAALCGLVGTLIASRKSAVAEMAADVPRVAAE